MDGECTSEMILERDTLRRIMERTGFEKPSGCLQTAADFLDAELEHQTPFHSCSHRHNGCPSKKECRERSKRSEDFFSGKKVIDQRFTRINMVKDMGGI